MAAFDDFLGAVLDGAKDIARAELQDGVDAFVADSGAFLKRTEAKPRTWTAESQRRARRGAVQEPADRAKEPRQDAGGDGARHPEGPRAAAA